MNGNCTVIDQDLQAIAGADLPWGELKGCTVMITGAGGFLPAYLVEALLYVNEQFLNRSAHVVALVRNPDRAKVRFQRYLHRPDLSFVFQDVTCALNYFGKADYIVHAASQASPKYYKTDPAGTLSANVLGTYHLLEFARQQALKNFLFFSSGDVYGIVHNTTAVTERDYGFVDPTDVRSCYGESKRMGENMCASWERQFGVPTSTVRPFHTYGPGMRLDDGRVFADFVRDILAGGPITLHSDGSARRCFCYLADATTAFLTVLLKGPRTGPYNVANTNAECSIAELADSLAELFADEGITVERKVRPDLAYLPSPIQALRPDISKIKSLGWSPSTSLQAGFLRTVRSYRA